MGQSLDDQFVEIKVTKMSSTFSYSALPPNTHAVIMTDYGTGTSYKRVISWAK